MNGLERKTCLVTGGTRGIGKAIAQRFASEGASVVITGVDSGDPPSWIAEDAHASNFSYCNFDVADVDEVFEAIKSVVAMHDCIDVLVNNAGVQFSELLGMASGEHTRRMFDVNALGAIAVTQQVSRVMQKQKKGSIVNIASAVGIYGNAGQTAYAASKGAVIAFTKAAAKELARYGIRVNAVAPGLVDTQMLAASDADKLRNRLERIPLGRVCQPDEIAAACAFLASDEASYITGQVLAVDGGAIL